MKPPGEWPRPCVSREMPMASPLCSLWRAFLWRRGEAEGENEAAGSPGCDPHLGEAGELGEGREG